MSGMNFNISLNYLFNCCIFHLHSAKPTSKRIVHNLVSFQLGKLPAINLKQSTAKRFLMPLLIPNVKIHLKIYKIY